MTLNGGGGSGAGGSRGAGKERERRRGSTPWGAAPPMHRRSMPVDDRDLQAALTPGARAASVAGSSTVTQGPRLDWAEGSSDSLSSGGSSSDESVYKVLLLGAAGVGKSALARIFGGVEDGPEAEAAGEEIGCSRERKSPGHRGGCSGERKYQDKGKECSEARNWTKWANTMVL